MNNLNDIRGNACTCQCQSETFCGERSLRRRLQQDCIACDNCRKDGVNGSQVWETGIKMLKVRSQRDEENWTHFHGVITRTTPKGTRLMNRRKPGLSESSKDTSSRQDGAIDSI